MAHACGITVEGEIGIIGQAKDDVEGKKVAAAMADPNECMRFVQETGVDCFAAAIGNAHGIYLEKPKLDFFRLKDFQSKIKNSLVLHGGTVFC
jgi:fructose/tagatose bisphosphate aldolase